MVKNLAVEGIVPLLADRRGVSAVPNANARNTLFRVATVFRQQPSRSRVVKSQRVTMNERERWPSTMSAYLAQRSNTLRLTCFSLRQPKVYCRDSGVTGVVAGGFDAGGRASKETDRANARWTGIGSLGLKTPTATAALLRWRQCAARNPSRAGSRAISDRQ
jgi:hypothetical protein